MRYRNDNLKTKDIRNTKRIFKALQKQYPQVFGHVKLKITSYSFAKTSLRIKNKFFKEDKIKVFISTRQIYVLNKKYKGFLGKEIERYDKSFGIKISFMEQCLLHELGHYLHFYTDYFDFYKQARKQEMLILKSELRNKSDLSYEERNDIYVTLPLEVAADKHAAIIALNKIDELLASKK